MDNKSTSGPSALAVVCFLLVAAGLACVVYWYPRFLFRTLGQDSPWTSYLYQYGMGLIVFLIGMFVIMKYRACQLDRGRDRFWFGVLICGFFLYAIVHAVWIVLALRVPFLGAA